MVETQLKRRKAGLKIDVTGENEKRASKEDRGRWSDKKIQREGSWSQLGTGKGCRPIKMVYLPREIARQHSHMHRHIPRRNEEAMVCQSDKLKYLIVVTTNLAITGKS